MPLYFCLFGTGYLIASFSLTDYEGRLECFGVSDKDVIVCSTGSSLLLFNIKGVYLQTIMYYTDWILRLWMVSLQCFPCSGVF